MYCSSRGVTTCQERKCSAVNIQLRVQQELSAIIISSQQNLPLSLMGLKRQYWQSLPISLQLLESHNTSLYVKQIYEAEPLWAFYLLKNLNYDGFVGGSAVPTLNRNDVHAYGISIPPLDLQKILCRQGDETNSLQGEKISQRLKNSKSYKELSLPLFQAATFSFIVVFIAILSLILIKTCNICCCTVMGGMGIYRFTKSRPLIPAAATCSTIVLIFSLP